LGTPSEIEKARATEERISNLFPGDGPGHLYCVKRIVRTKRTWVKKRKNRGPDKGGDQNRSVQRKGTCGIGRGASVRGGALGEKG